MSARYAEPPAPVSGTVRILRASRGERATPAPAITPRRRRPTDPPQRPLLHVDEPHQPRTRPPHAERPRSGTATTHDGGHIDQLQGRRRTTGMSRNPTRGALYNRYRRSAAPRECPTHRGELSHRPGVKPLPPVVRRSCGTTLCGIWGSWNTCAMSVVDSRDRTSRSASTRKRITPMRHDHPIPRTQEEVTIDGVD